MRNFEQWNLVEDALVKLKQLRSLMGLYCGEYLDQPVALAQERLPSTYEDQNNLMSLVMTVTCDATEALQAVDAVFTAERKEATPHDPG